MQIEDDVRSPEAAGLGDEPPLRAPFPTRRGERASCAANDRVITVSVSKRGAEGVQHFILCGRRDRLKCVRVLADIVPGEDAAVRDGVVRDERVQIKVRKPGAMAVPLIGDAT